MCVSILSYFWMARFSFSLVQLWKKLLRRVGPLRPQRYYPRSEQWFVLIAAATLCHQSPPYMSMNLDAKSFLLPIYPREPCYILLQGHRGSGIKYNEGFLTSWGGEIKGVICFVDSSSKMFSLGPRQVPYLPYFNPFMQKFSLHKLP